MRLYIIRHGETAWNRERRLQGQTDIPLNAFGEKLAEETGRGLSEVPFDLCIASPLTRTRQTALQVLRENRAFLNRKGRAELSDFCSAEDFRREAAEELAAGKDPWNLEFPLLTDKRIIEIDFGIWAVPKTWRSRRKVSGSFSRIRKRCRCQRAGRPLRR